MYERTTGNHDFRAVISSIALLRFCDQETWSTWQLWSHFDFRDLILISDFIVIHKCSIKSILNQRLFSPTMHCLTGVIFDQTGSYDTAFYLSGALSFMGTLLLCILIVRKSRTSKAVTKWHAVQVRPRSLLHGDDQLSQDITVQCFEHADVSNTLSKRMKLFCCFLR